MTKRLLAVLMTIALCAYLLVGCTEYPGPKEEISRESSFVIVEDGASYYIVYHKDTKVMYTLSTGGYNCGSFCLLMNPDGTPMVWEVVE